MARFQRLQMSDINFMAGSVALPTRPENSHSGKYKINYVDHLIGESIVPNVHYACPKKTFGDIKTNNLGKIFVYKNAKYLYLK